MGQSGGNPPHSTAFLELFEFFRGVLARLPDALGAPRAPQRCLDMPTGPVVKGTLEIL